MLGNFIFWVAAAVAISMAIVVVTAKNSMHGVIALVANFVMLGVLFLLLHAEFLALVEILVYAGAVMVLFLFVVTLLFAGTKPPEEGRGRNLRGQTVSAILLGGGILALVVFALAVKTTIGPTTNAPNNFGSIFAFGQALFTTYLLPFELTALVLLVAVIGVVFLARERN